MDKVKEFQKEIKIGEAGYINKNCWLAKNLGYPPSKRCQYCESKFPNCLFFRYLIITLGLVFFIFVTSFLIGENISRLVVVSIFILVIIYGYFFSKSTDDIIVANFAQRKAKELFENLSKTLQQKVDEQTKDIKQAYEIEKKAHEELKLLDQNKTEFMLITQHHLRTPLTSMMGYMDLIDGGAYGKVPKKLNEIIHKVSNSSQNLIKIVNEFLDLSQFQLGEKVVLLRDDVDIRVILEKIVKELDFEAEKKGISLNFEKSKENILPIKVDPSKLQIALSNVIDNSIKYTPKGGVTIQVKNKTTNSDRKIEIIVKDTGIGMEKKDIDSLFSNLLVRGEGAKKVNVTGRGIGLFLSAKIIEAHNGKIWAESAGTDKGSTFHIELPVGD